MKLDEFEYDLLKFVKKESLIKDGDFVLLAVSGGADSMAMMHAFSKIRDHLSADFLVAHLNHMIRKEAEIEGKGVSDFAKSLGFECVVESRNVPEYLKTHKGLSIEEGARVVRYDFFEAVASKYGANKIATAHHLSDLTENFFLRLFRGSGVGGLIGMSPARGKYIKPFLIFDEQRIRNYVKIYRIPFFEDKTNFDTRYLRNRIRHLLIPEIKKDFCPQIEKMVFNISTILRMYQDHLGKEISEKFDLNIVNDRICLKLEDLRKEDDLVLSELFKMILNEMGVNISHRKIDSCVKIVKDSRYHELNLGQGVYVIKDKDVCVGKKKEEIFWSPLELLVPGSVQIKELSIKIYSEFEEGEIKLGDSKNCVTIDAGKITFPLVVRPAKDERIIPFGMKEEVRVKDILKKRGVSAEMRRIFPVVAQKDGKIIWIVGITFSDDLKVTKNTRKILTLIREGGAF
ncbi:MAG: tRNA lysidine(34) synthetase TilS [Mesoaciditoga sp.]|uniref:tRNA lysidine(34) synthetase TilS n=1 Tax=Athalassotoga sp. TaxID=2022597 RepID=UPI000CB6FEE1|nr:MAG: tRNA lysidine(34) synthetase TilS [Mesoaciditoga sp.]PMP80029.1 MAG: tRNA lysidine(34) synthetase TilS [Mesoaciditoga sp.]HEU23657.1 tRNA lysidine(34) synthetase TilS [Mesoaciditoga lauensis]